MRKLLIKSAQYWYDAAKNNNPETKNLRLRAMEDALNHTESALKAALDKLKDISSFSHTHGGQIAAEFLKEFEKLNGNK